MLNQDVLENKNKFDPRVMETVKRHLEVDPIACSNSLPICHTISRHRFSPICSVANSFRRSMTVTIQKELADRFVGEPGSKDYGALSIWMQSLCDVKSSGSCRPKFSGRVRKLNRPSFISCIDRRKGLQIPDLDFFHAFVRSMFFHRRKFMRSVAISAFKGQLDKPQVDEVLEIDELWAGRANRTVADSDGSRNCARTFASKLIQTSTW